MLNIKKDIIPILVKCVGRWEGKYVKIYIDSEESFETQHHKVSSE